MDAHTTATSPGDGRDGELGSSREVANPDGEYSLSCQYVLGDFNQSGDPKKGYRFIAGGTLKSTGNIGIKLRVIYKWQ